MTTALSPLPDRLTLEDLQKVHLSYGSHRRREDGVCFNEACAWFAGEPHSDRPPCLPYVLGTLTMRVSDRLPDAVRDKFIRDLVPVVVGADGSEASERTRRYMLADWLVRQRTPAFLRLAGLTADAEILEGLARIVDEATLAAARPTLYGVRDRARAERDKKWAALGVAPGAIAIAISASAIASASDIAIAIAISASDIAIAIASASASEWPLKEEWAAEVDRQRWSLVQLIKDMAAVGRKEIAA